MFFDHLSSAQLQKEVEYGLKGQIQVQCLKLAEVIPRSKHGRVFCFFVFLHQTENIFIPAVKLGILKWDPISDCLVFGASLKATLRKFDSNPWLQKTKLNDAC